MSQEEFYTAMNKMERQKWRSLLLFSTIFCGNLTASKIKKLSHCALDQSKNVDRITMINQNYLLRNTYSIYLFLEM